MTDERGQALVFTVLILGLAAAVMVGLRDAQEVILDRVRDGRASEAAAAAAGAIVADAAFARSGGGQRHLAQAETGEIAGDAGVLAGVRSVASQMAMANGRRDPAEVTVHAYGYELEVHVTLGGHRQIALIEPPP